MSGIFPPLQTSSRLAKERFQFTFIHWDILCQSRDKLCVCNATSKRMKQSDLSHCTWRESAGIAESV